MRRSSRLVKMAVVSLLSAVAIIMQYLDFPLPVFPGFLKVDFSDVPALLAGLILGPWLGVLVQFLKNVLHFLFTGSETGIPIGEMANFFAGSILVLCTVWVARKIRGHKGLAIGLVTGTVVMAFILTVANYFVIFPAYAFFLGWPINGPEKTALVLYGVAPFNVVKGLLVSLVFIPIYIKLKPGLQRQMSLK